jgi:hypothetical protein
MHVRTRRCQACAVQYEHRLIVRRLLAVGTHASWEPSLSFVQSVDLAFVCGEMAVDSLYRSHSLYGNGVFET